MNNQKDRFDIMRLIKQGEEFDREHQKTPQQPVNFVSDETMLLLNHLQQLQASMNTMLTQIAGMRYALQKTDAEFMEKMDIGTVINEYVNIRLIIDAYRAKPGVIDMNQLKGLNIQLNQVEKHLLEKGSEYLVDAKEAYAAYVKNSKEKKSDENNI